MSAAPAAAPSVLIIEDETLVALELETLVQGLGYCVSGIADRCDKAVAAARAHRPDLILADIRLRGGDNGIDAVDEIRGFAGDIPVIVVSGSPRDLATQRLARYSVVPKPYDPHILAREIRTALGTA